MKNFFKKNIDLIVTSVLLIIIISINVHPESIIMGLDNSSPYFQPFEILERIKGTSSIVYGGLIFQLPFLGLLSKLDCSPEILSNIYVFTNLITGSFGITFLLKREFNRPLLTITGVFILLTNLFTFWIFGNPNFLFIASFGSIPFLVYLLSNKNLNLYQIILLILFSLSFLTTTLNLVAFTIYTFCILILVFILNKDRKHILKRLFLWLLCLIFIWFATIQTTMYLNGDKTLFPVRIYEYTEQLLENPYVTSNTSGIIDSEKTNTLTRTMSFALGWMELHTSNNTPIFNFYELYRENLFYILLGLIPFLLASVSIFLKTEKRNILLTIVLLLFILISSKYGISIIEKIPYLNNSLRWASSKLWPFYIIPLILLSVSTINILTKTPSKLIKYSVVLPILTILFIYGFPVLSGNLLTSQTLVTIPEEYDNLPDNSTILVLPIPQMSYMREYDWGYYGSDFLVHLTNSEIIDGANLYEYGIEYTEIFNTRELPENIEYVMYDKSSETNLSEEDINKSKSLLEGLEMISSNEYFDLYER